jgi:hypothetical protein
MQKKKDVILEDHEGILAFILCGPKRRTSITLNKKNALYFAWCPYKTDEGLINAHLNEILENMKYLFGSVSSEYQVIRS